MNWLPKQKIIVPIDFSDESFKALDSALALVESPSNIHVIHVLPDMSPSEPGVVWGVVDKESRIRHVREAIAKRLADDRYKGVDMKVSFGDPGHEITAFAKHAGADLIVMPSHGRTGMTRLLIGSVAERVIRLAHCPVLVMRAS